MVYQSNIPLATDQISVSQGDILGNFQALGPLVNGIIEMPPQLVAPPFTPGNNTLYSLLYATTGLNEVFLRNAAGVSFPITAQINTGVTGWTYLPSGMKILWSRSTILAGNSTATVSFAIATFPGFTTSALGISITRINNATANNFIMLESNTNTQFVARRSTSNTGSSDQFAWIAIGL